MLLLTHEVTNLHEQKESFKRDQNLFQVQNVEARINALTNCLASMKNTYCSVQAMDLVQPVRVLGIKCEGRTAVVMVYTLFLFIVALLQYAYFGSFTV